MFDVLSGVGLGLVGLLLTPALAALIAIESGRPIFYHQRRLGRGGRPFHLTKFRTMKVDAEADGEARWSVVGDPRVTRVGRFLRRTRLDEVPNVLAVLRGEMSMVGPRPERPEFVGTLERTIPLYRARLVVAPGLTGWAQVNHPYSDSIDDSRIKLGFDLYYIKHQTLWFDLRILLRTVWTTLKLGGR
jgi:lipopolysaccharide/colanic/teichoic acid biosynthesis glycosyltransferase